MSKFLFCLFFMLFSLCCFSQRIVNSIQLSGFVVNGNKSYGIPGSHIIIKNQGKGTISNNVGYFSLPVMTGDTLLISAVGFKTKSIIIPQRDDTGFSVIVDLQIKTTYLPVVEITPFSTVEEFETAFLALNLTTEKLKNIQKTMNKQVMMEFSNSYPSANANYRYFVDQQNQYNAQQFFIPTLSLTNPFAWAKFLESIKKKKKKKSKK